MEYWDLASYKSKNSWAGDEDGEVLWPVTPAEFEQLPDGTRLKCINDEWVTKGDDYIDTDIRFGFIAYGLVEYLV